MGHLSHVDFIQFISTVFLLVMSFLENFTPSIKSSEQIKKKLTFWRLVLNSADLHGIKTVYLLIKFSKQLVVLMKDFPLWTGVMTSLFNLHTSTRPLVIVKVTSLTGSTE